MQGMPEFCWLITLSVQIPVSCKYAKLEGRKWGWTPVRQEQPHTDRWQQCMAHTAWQGKAVPTCPRWNRPILCNANLQHLSIIVNWGFSSLSWIDLTSWSPAIRDTHAICQGRTLIWKDHTYEPQFTYDPPRFRLLTKGRTSVCGHLHYLCVLVTGHWVVYQLSGLSISYAICSPPIFYLQHSNATLHTHPNIFMEDCKK